MTVEFVACLVTLFALAAGAVEFGTKRGRKTVNIVTDAAAV